MALTKRGFEKGEEPRSFQPDDQYGAPGDATQSLLKGLAATQNSKASKGLTGDGAEDYDAGTGDQVSNDGSPRRHGTAQREPAGNDASTGSAGPLPAGPANMPGPSTTGAGQGSKVVVTYGPGSGKTNRK